MHVTIRASTYALLLLTIGSLRASSKAVTSESPNSLHRRKDLPAGLTPGGSKRDGQDWNYLQQYFNRDLDESLRGYWDKERIKGTFWNVEKVHKFPAKLAYRGDATDKSAPIINTCVLVFYYPGFWKLLTEKGGDKDDITDLFGGFYQRPLAVAPLCGQVAKDDIPEPGYTSFPRGNEDANDGENSLVFHSYFTESVETDLYFVVRENQKDKNIRHAKDWRLNETDDTAIFLANSNPAYMPVKIRNPTDGKPTTEAKDAIWSLYLEWAENENDGLVPNPYQYGVGFDGWGKWSQIWSFWGYDESNASRRLHP